MNSQNKIFFRDINPEEFEDYKIIFVKDYSEDLVANHGYTTYESVVYAENTLQQSFPMKVSNTGEKLMCIDAEIGSVGYLWYSIDKETSKAFISDFYIYENFRSQGYGQATLIELEAVLAKQQINYLGLRVANNNPRALKLYQRQGFNISGYNMCKRISKSPD